MGICAFRDKNVHFDAMDEKDARVEMIRKYLDRRQTPHIQTVHAASGSSSDSEDILVEETLERPPPVPPRPPTLDFAAQGDKPEARLSMATMSLPMVEPTAKDHGTGLGALKMDTVSIPAILGTPSKNSHDEDVLVDSNPFENEEEASIPEAPVSEDVVFEDLIPEAGLQVRALEQASDSSPSLPAQVFTLDSPEESPLHVTPSAHSPQAGLSEEELPLSLHEDLPPPSLAIPPLQPSPPTPVEGTEDADYMSQSSDATPTYHDVPTRTRESRFTEFESPGRYSSQGLDEAAFVFLRMKSHYLRNPAPLLAPELLQRNTQGQLTIQEEENFRQSR